MPSRIIVKSKKSSLPLRQGGDTIIEVMLSIAIAALAIAMAYTISGKNLNVGITARERTQALGLVQGQIERMSQASQSSSFNPQNPVYKTAAKHFCFDGNSTPQTNPGPLDPTNNNLAGDAGNYIGACIASSKYYLDINYVTPAGSGPTASGDSYAFTARWYQIGGGADQVVTLYYRPW